MPAIETTRLRNVALLSHSGAGKTVIAESMLFATGAITRQGSVQEGTTASDYEPEEQRREASVQTAIVQCMWRDHKINLLDTPGYADFRGEVISAIRVAEAAVIVVAAPSGVEVGTQQMWRMADERGLPRLLFVNKLDRENTDFLRVLDSISETFGRKCVAVQVAVGSETDFSAVVSLLDPKAEAPAGMEDQVEEARERLIEAVAERTGLQDLLTETADTLSHGQKQWLEIAMVVLQEPKLFLVDEPAAGMSDEESFKTGELLQGLAVDHSLIVIEHDMKFVRQIARKVTVLHEGRVLMEGSMEEVQSDPRVIECYLGTALEREAVDIAS